MAKGSTVAANDISEEEQEYLERTALLGLEYVLADFVREFQSATRRWERIAFPAMVIFAFLAVSGFWLIYSITEDMHRMSQNIDPKMSENLGEMSKNMALLVVSVDKMSANIESMDKSIGAMQGDIAYMSGNIAQMNQSIYTMTWNTGVMSKDMNRLNQSIGKPMRFMNNFLP